MQFSIDSSKLLRGFILTAISIFLIHLERSGAIHFLVSPIMTTVIGMAVIPLSVISIMTLVSSLLKLKTIACTHEIVNPHEHEEGEGHHHLDHKSFWYRLTIGLMLLFIVLAVTWHPSSLGTNMISDQTSSMGSNLSTVSQSTSASGNQLISTERKGPTQATIAFKYNQNPKRFIGKSFNMIGFVYHPSGLSKNQFILTRFFIFCCIADAIPIGVAVESPHAAQINSNTWVQVSGILQEEELPVLEQIEPTASWVPRDNNQPVLIAHAIKSIPVPSQPYMVPGL
ncbi:TIGR03943 family protein [Pullulanibacillus sp. KACC 23026]|uniref:TIGR03943 family putative permease subunit n=1 Tax=Pullulanibacillus sp. KACC 23026 TaxID=3028315 RepID=UPI0023B05443|nr:TIGR03943 family protein [Pullulanibacillus sp. KACC 23026]WEG13672.1 TIGR03943 family protein [Pullulanibacillus sp. KACC 23026]